MIVHLEVDTDTGAVTVLPGSGTTPTPPAPDDDSGLEARVTALEASLTEVESSLAGVEAGLESTALPWFEQLQARANFRPWGPYTFTTGPDETSVRINDSSPTSPTDPTPLGDIPLIFGNAVVMVLGDPNAPGSPPFATGYNFLDIVTQPGITYTVLAIEPIAAPTPPELPGPPSGS